MTCSNKVSTRKCAYQSKQPFSQLRMQKQMNLHRLGVVCGGEISAAPVLPLPAPHCPLQTHHLKTTAKQKVFLKKKPSSKMPAV